MKMQKFRNVVIGVMAESVVIPDMINKNAGLNSVPHSVLFSADTLTFDVRRSRFA